MSNRVEIYWDGRTWDFDGNDRPPTDNLHATWLRAHELGFEVTGTNVTPAGHKPRAFVPSPPTRDAEAKYEDYLGKVTPTKTPIAVKP